METKKLLERELSKGHKSSKNQEANITAIKSMKEKLFITETILDNLDDHLMVRFEDYEKRGYIEKSMIRESFYLQMTVFIEAQIKLELQNEEVNQEESKICQED